MKETEIIRDVALLLGEDPGQTDGEGFSFPSLADRIRVEIAGAARRLILATEAGSMSGARRLPTEGVTAGEDGSVAITLPEDFLKLKSVMMEDWQSPLTEAYPPGHWLLRLQEERWPALRGSRERPLAFIADTAEGGRELRIFSSRPGAGVAGGWYFAEPETGSSGEIGIPPELRMELLEKLKESVGT